MRIYNLTGKRVSHLEPFIEHCMDQLGITQDQAFDLLVKTVKTASSNDVTSSSATLASFSYYHDFAASFEFGKKYLIELSDSGMNQLKCMQYNSVAHEFVHFEQVLTKKMGVLEDEYGIWRTWNGKPIVRLGKRVSYLQYRRFPWEKDARRRARIITFNFYKDKLKSYLKERFAK